MSIGEFCNREVVIVAREATAGEAARLMRSHHVGSLVVVDEMIGGKRVPIGIVTDRDLVVEIMATGLDPNTITVGDIMTPGLVTAQEGDEVLPTIELMHAKGVRRLPVVDAEGALAGIVSIDDLIEIMADHLSALTRVIAREQAREARDRK